MGEFFFGLQLIAQKMYRQLEGESIAYCELRITICFMNCML